MMRQMMTIAIMAAVFGAVACLFFLLLEPIFTRMLYPEEAVTGVTYPEETETGAIMGLYILHPNNVGRCGHICNASYAVRRDQRGRHLGEALVKDCLVQAKKLGYRVLQFNAVVENNIHARHLYERLGFVCWAPSPAASA